MRKIMFKITLLAVISFFLAACQMSKQSESFAQPIVITPFILSDEPLHVVMDHGDVENEYSHYSKIKPAFHEVLTARKFGAVVFHKAPVSLSASKTVLVIRVLKWDLVHDEIKCTLYGTLTHQREKVDLGMSSGYEQSIISQMGSAHERLGAYNRAAKRALDKLLDKIEVYRLR
jgi:hypothetical protein